ncbi:helix-turn-helix transcriptional regulator [Solwaraspora sp. WMMD406]|uniref:helix-turn-helix transcriptional regulator n=1 Tax=Solwaraspora sp. WMMD406 TaxID=3016095 RepID=UPI0024179196|nr:helix-turn-helix transcriptional regulator [Solwaraspora sp. WMMD406]MDG4767446.1 helix-turn-helix transcriptional regulator [Solwaraspora sp. WMMD406]
MSDQSTGLASQARVHTGPGGSAAGPDRPGTTMAWPAQLTETSLAVYRHAAATGQVSVESVVSTFAWSRTDAERACATLLSLRLLEPGRQPGTFVPVHPDRARALASEPLVDEILVRRSAIEFTNRQLERAAQALSDTVRIGPDGDGIRVVSDPVQVRREINEMLLACTEEVLVTQPGGARGPLPDPIDPGLLRPGVRCRILRQHTVRANLGMRTYAKVIADHGGQVRTTGDALEHLLLVDGSAVLPLAPPQEPESGSVVLTHAPVVEFLRRGFDRAWSYATPYAGDCDDDYRRISAEIRMSVLRLMAAGLKDEAIAHRLGLATRTCRRHVAAIMEELNVTSRFQAGVRIAELGLLPLNEDVSVAGRGSDSYPFW